MKHLKKIEERLAVLEERCAELEIPAEYRNRICIFQLPEDQEALDKYEAWFRKHPDPRKNCGVNYIVLRLQERPPEPGESNDGETAVEDARK